MDWMDSHPGSQPASGGGRGIKERAHPQAGDERVVRGTTPFRLTGDLNKNSRRCCDGDEKASLTQSGYDQVEVYTLCPDNGGSSGSGYSAFAFSPCDSEVHSVLVCGRDFHLSTALWPPVQRLLVLFLVFVC